MLQKQLDLVNYEKKELLKALLDSTRLHTEEVRVNTSGEQVEVKPKFVPWRVKQQELEAEDRQKARILQEKLKEIELSKLPVIKVDVSDLEAEMDIAGEKANEQ